MDQKTNETPASEDYSQKVKLHCSELSKRIQAFDSKGPVKGVFGKWQTACAVWTNFLEKIKNGASLETLESQFVGMRQFYQSEASRFDWDDSEGGKGEFPEFKALFLEVEAVLTAINLLNRKSDETLPAFLNSSITKEGSRLTLATDVVGGKDRCFALTFSNDNKTAVNDDVFRFCTILSILKIPYATSSYSVKDCHQTFVTVLCQDLLKLTQYPLENAAVVDQSMAQTVVDKMADWAVGYAERQQVAREQIEEAESARAEEFRKDQQEIAERKRLNEEQAEKILDQAEEPVVDPASEGPTALETPEKTQEDKAQIQEDANLVSHNPSTSSEIDNANSKKNWAIAGMSLFGVFAVSGIAAGILVLTVFAGPVGLAVGAVAAIGIGAGLIGGGALVGGAGFAWSAYHYSQANNAVERLAGQSQDNPSKLIGDDFVQTEASVPKQQGINFDPSSTVVYDVGCGASTNDESDMKSSFKTR